jgi:hypothetical protein
MNHNRMDASLYCKSTKSSKSSMISWRNVKNCSRGTINRFMISKLTLELKVKTRRRNTNKWAMTLKKKSDRKKKWWGLMNSLMFLWLNTLSLLLSLTLNTHKIKKNVNDRERNLKGYRTNLMELTVRRRKQTYISRIKKSFLLWLVTIIYLNNSRSKEGIRKWIMVGWVMGIVGQPLNSLNLRTSSLISTTLSFKMSPMLSWMKT